MKPFHADLQNGSPEIAILAKARSFIASTTEPMQLRQQVIRVYEIAF